MLLRYLSAAAVAACLLWPASAATGPHHAWKTPDAPPHAWYRAVFRVPHGCEGAATIRLIVRLPEGITGARPMPKPGWSLTLTPRDPNAPPPTGHGATPEIGVITWEGGPLPNAYYDEFVIRFRTPNTPGQTIWIPGAAGMRGWPGHRLEPNASTRRACLLPCSLVFRSADSRPAMRACMMLLRDVAVLALLSPRRPSLVIGRK